MSSFPISRLSRHGLKGAKNLPTVSSQTSLSARAYATPSKQKRRTAIVTRSSQGIGKAIALRLAEDGYDILVNDVQTNETGVLEVVKEVKSLGRNAFPYLADVSKLNEVERMVETSVSELGPLNIMITNAGIAGFGSHRAGCASNVRNKHSVAAFKPSHMLSHYTASKWAVRGLTISFALEIAAHKITVNAYAPGVVGTAMWDLINEEMGKKTGAKKGETIKKWSEELIALGRTSVPSDASNLVSFLSDPDSDYTTGQTILVDGGMVYTYGRTL
ncbi:acetoin dehydrogenase-like protein [Mytilinidion resinicola]|uniref:3-oxoacyl-[acyl-carrier-protein] reductase n=1 Tax=Mytilinidion resinicola TaxID=574789 RepID=A0A6A6Z8D4_9PEZI|nr:acetoin dehydrogenase-like protein [Mytilinidion resinicola]KAF2817276.1 acetoin dehydrogenase-like protein [Mytilinidion resinicola]